MNTQLLTAFAIVGVAMAADFRVTVGISQVTGHVGTGLDPNRIVPSAGDTITFSWLIPSYIQDPATGTYSVTQGTFENPCHPMPGGFDSGPRTTGPESAGQAPTMTFNVRDDKPLYFYSSVDDQCKKGMVLGVNTPAIGTGSIESYIIAAGGDPNADTTTNSTTTTGPVTAVNATAPIAPKTQASPTANNTTRLSTTTGSANTTTAKPQNGAGSLITPQSSFAFIGLMTAALFL